MFFDNASTTKIDSEIIEKFNKINDEYFYNAGGLYTGGRNSRQFIDNCRDGILNSLNATDGKLIFTGSATEANNLAILGSVRKITRKILVSMGEHPSVYNVALELKNRGFDVQFVNLDSSGKVDIDDFKQKLTEDVDLVSIMHVSNEVGAVNDIATLCDLAKSVNPKVIFHCDGVQAVGKINVNIDDLGVDLYTMSAHKIGGMKGVGVLYVKRGTMLKPIIFGGGQEDGLRSGTENVLGIFTLNEAIKNRCENLSENFYHVQNLKENFLKGLSKFDSKINYKLHSGNDCSPYIISISFDRCRAETILNMLSDKGVYVGNGSACSSKKSGNRILENMGVSKSEIEGNIRISFSPKNTIQEVDELVKILSETILEYLQKVR